MSRTSPPATPKPLGDGRLALPGHSMASDIVVRAAQARDDVTATVAVSMFSRAVTADSPRDLPVIVGQWEGMLIDEARRVVSLSLAPGEEARAGVTYGDPGAGAGRRMAIIPNVEHAAAVDPDRRADNRGSARAQGAADPIPAGAGGRLSGGAFSGLRSDLGAVPRGAGRAAPARAVGAGAGGGGRERGVRRRRAGLADRQPRHLLRAGAGADRAAGRDAGRHAGLFSGLFSGR